MIIKKNQDTCGASWNIRNHQGLHLPPRDCIKLVQKNKLYQDIQDSVRLRAPILLMRANAKHSPPEITRKTQEIMKLNNLENEPRHEWRLPGVSEV